MKKGEKDVCRGLSFSDCELAILRQAVDKAESKMGAKVVSDPEIKRIISIVEGFLRRKSLICYGGTAINNILPPEDQFYESWQLADYDFFTTKALEDAKELADIYFAQGFTDVEAKAGSHHGTFKVFVNYIPVADITYLPQEIFSELKKESMRVNGILYAPPNYLRMSMYLELSRPVGDISRWEKVLKRLTLLNKNYPVTDADCRDVEYQRKVETDKEKREAEIHDVVRDTFVNQGVVFFGGYAVSLYSQYMPDRLRKQLKKVADFDVLSNDPKTTAEIVKERLADVGVEGVEIIKREPVGEVVPVHYEIRVGKEDTIAFIYEPIACHSYNVLMIRGKKVKIATIDTMLSFYLAFLYANRPYYNEFLKRILCISKFLFEVQQKNRLKQKGLLRRFSITCYGHQETLEEMRAHRAEKYQELRSKKGTKEYEEWFLSYKPEDKTKKEQKDILSKIKGKVVVEEPKKAKKKRRKTKKKGLFGFGGGTRRRQT